MFEELVALIGKPVRSEEIMNFFEKESVAYPKKDSISNTAAERGYWVQVKTLGLDFYFTISINHPAYPALAGERKGIFIPRLQSIRVKGKSKLVLPMAIWDNADYAELLNGRVEPTTWNILGSIARRWDIPLKEGDVVLQVSEDGEYAEIDAVSITIKEAYVLQPLYDPLLYQTVAHIRDTQHDAYTKGTLFFLHWAAERAFLQVPEDQRSTIEAYQTDTSTLVDLAEQRFADRHYLSLADFKEVDQTFISHYLQNLSGHDIVYQRDFALTFLKENNTRNNYLGAEASDELRKIAYNKENLQRVVDLIDKRYKEFKLHGFSKSTNLNEKRVPSFFSRM